MADAAKIVERMERQREAELDRLAEEAMRDTDYRVYQATHVPIKRRGRRVHRIQKLSLIHLAAQRKILKRQVLHLVHWRVEHMVEEPEKDIQELITIKNFLERGKTVEQDWGRA